MADFWENFGDVVLIAVVVVAFLLGYFLINKLFSFFRGSGERRDAPPPEADKNKDPGNPFIS